MSIRPETRFSNPPPAEYLPDGFPQAWEERTRLYVTAAEAVRHARELHSDEATRDAEKADRAIRVQAAKAGKRIPTDSPNVDRLTRDRVDADRQAEALVAALADAESEVGGVLCRGIEDGTLPAYRIRDQLRGEVADLLDQLAAKLSEHDQADAAAAWALTPKPVTNRKDPTIVRVVDLPGCGGMGHTATATRLTFADLVGFLRDQYAPPEPEPQPEVPPVQAPEPEAEQAVAPTKKPKRRPVRPAPTEPL